MKPRDPLIESTRLDRSAFAVVPLHDVANDRSYWLSRPPEERWRAVELLRRINYGAERCTARLERVLEIVEVPWG